MSRDTIAQAWEAAKFNKLENLKTIVPSQVDPNAMNITSSNQCHSLLMSACAYGSIKCAVYLIESGANTNLKNFNGFTALHWAAFTGKTETLSLLLTNNADIESRTNDGKTPLHVAAMRGHHNFILELLHNGADLSAVDAEGLNCLHMAIIGNQPSVAEWLLKQNIDLATELTGSKQNALEFSKNKCSWFESSYNNAFKSK